MKLRAMNVGWLLPFFLTACIHLPFHKSKPPVQPVAPAIDNTPPPRPETSPTILPPSAATIPAQPTPDIQTAAKPTKPPKAPPKRRKPQPPPPPPQQAASGVPAVSAIGKLSSGDPPDVRQQTVELLTATERGLSSVNRKLSDQEQKTAAQIKAFLKQARTALSSGDVDGARTLAAKAKVLLQEIVR